MSSSTVTAQGKYIRYSADDCDSSELCITDIYVPKEQRGRGYGRELVEEAKKYARLNGYNTVGLYACPNSDDGLDGEALIEFYASCGFESDNDDAAMMTWQVR